jgi:hypothetical protein
MFFQAIDTIRAAAPVAPPASWWDHAKTVTETLKGLAEAFAFIAAGGYFLYKTFSGYLVENLTLSLDCERKGSQNDTIDYLAITVRVKKGDRGAVILHDAQAKISSPAAGETQLKKLAGTIRLSFKKSGDTLAIVEKQSEKAPLLNLSPGEETMFSTFFTVPSDRPCTVEVTVLGGWPWHFKTAYQWRASQVSLPIR